MNKKTYIALAVIIVLLAAVIGATIFIKNKNNNDDDINDTLLNEENEVKTLSKDEIIKNYISEFGGELIEQNSDIYYIKKDDKEYTLYEDGTILEGRISIWDGSESKPAIDEAGNINIYNPAELKWVANQVISGNKNFAGVTISLRANLDFGGRCNETSKEWTGIAFEPIVGTNESGDNFEAETQVLGENVSVKEESLKRFAGVFDGTDHTIIGLNIKSDKDYVGLFGYTTGTICNLTIKNSLAQGQNSVGVIAGLNGGTIVNCKSIDCTVKGDNKVGGIVGISMPGSRIENVQTEDFIEGNDYIAGIAGYSNNNVTIINAYSNSIIKGKNYVAGITGISFYGTVISNSSSDKTIVGENDNIGGIVGYSEATIEKCMSKADIKGTRYVGGIAGTNINTGIIESCFNESTLKVNGDLCGGIVGINNAIIQHTYNKGTISSAEGKGIKVGGIAGQNSTNSMIVYSYNVGKMISPTADGLIGDNYGSIDKCYLLNTSVERQESDGEIKTSEELSQLAETLGEAYKNDENNINSGYPILIWQ